MNSDYLSYTNTKCLKGILSISILIHHLYQHSRLFEGSVIGMALQSIGMLAVAVFFFLSGYGLETSYREKGDSYAKSIPSKKIIPLYVNYLIILFLYCILWVTTGEKTISAWSIFISLTWGGTLVSKGWYLQATFFLYALYWLVYSHCKNKKNLNLFIGIALYCLLCVLLSVPTTWYQSIFCFSLGVEWADYKDKIDAQLAQGNWGIITGSCFTLFAISLICSSQMPLKCKVLLYAVSVIFFTLWVVLLLMRLRIQFTFTKWLGKYSFEIYVTQGIGLYLFRSRIINIQNLWLYVICCTVLTVLLSMIFHPLFQAVRNGIKRIATR